MKDTVIIELDGPPMAYFNIPYEDQEGYLHTICITFRTISFKSKDREKLQQHFDSVLNLIRAELYDQVTPIRTAGIIWWRTRPEWAQNRKMWYVYARLATSPDPMEEFWDQFIKKEGDEPRTID